MSKSKLNIIVACAENNGIGFNGDLPWTLKNEMKHFSKLTRKTEDSAKKNVVLMGRNTWQSIPAKFRPLPGRINLVVSSQASKNPEKFEGCIPCNTFDKALEKAYSLSEIENIWVIGGSSIYKAALESPHLHRVYLTKVLKTFECDTFLPEISFDRFKIVSDPSVSTEEQQEGDIKYKYEIYEKV